MFYTISLYASLTIFTVGLVYKVSNWFRYKVDHKALDISTAQRLSAAARAIGAALFTKKIVVLLKTLFLDGLCQRWLLKISRFRWVAHMCIYGGFMLLLIMHALDRWVAPLLFSDYYPTLNPFLFLRNVFALFVLLGIAIAVYRRAGAKTPRPKTTAWDYAAIVLLAVIMISGVLLEAVKISSQSVFEMMAADYAGISAKDEQELEALSTYWVQYFGVVTPDLRAPLDKELLRQGEELHQINCMQCHDRPQWAFISYGIARMARSVAAPLDRADAPTWLWYLHILACFVGLAYLPFSKFFHIIASPVFLVARTLANASASNPANRATLRAIGLDACTHCGDCTSRCSVAVTVNNIPNPGILPSEKLATFRRLMAGRRLSKIRLIHIQEASHICTDCHRCSDVCPMGIDLESLWADLKCYAADLGYPKPEAWARNSLATTDFSDRPDVPLSISPEGVAFMDAVTWTAQAKTFTACYDCRNCTNVCPVVGMYASPRKVLGLLPHEIMHCLALKQQAPVLKAGMLWACTTCYLCQEQCPQGVCITDLLFQLKSLTLQQMKQEACHA
ncbi:MAG: 4Fe-4S dicluster domain-containing protein [Desulfatitalea sp.]